MLKNDSRTTFAVAVQMKAVTANIDEPTRRRIKATVARCADALVGGSPGSQNQNARGLDEQRVTKNVQHGVSRFVVAGEDSDECSRKQHKG
jgi:hypothetical protein